MNPQKPLDKQQTTSTADSGLNKSMPMPTPCLDDNWQSDVLDMSLGYGEQTMAVRAGYHRTDEGEHNEAIFTTSSYVYKNAEDAYQHFNGSLTGNVYSRHTNPSVRTFERRLAALEGGERAVATATGMGAILVMCLAYLKAGDHLLASKQLFGSTVGLFNNYMGKFGVSVSYVDCTDLAAWQAAMQENTKLIFCESPSNPLAELCDIQFLAELAHKHDALLAVDNCFTTPAIQKPLALGADIVIHSATKYIDGQGRVMGGALVGNDELMQQAFVVVRSAGVTMSPFNAWVFTKGLETLSLRMQAHCDNANKIAHWLDAHPKVAKVHFSGLPHHHAHELAKRQHHKANSFGAMIGFEVVCSEEQGRQAAWHVIDSTRMISISNNLGDAKTIVTHPATTTHYRMGAEAREEAGVKESLIRLSVGLEDVDDIIADLARGLDTV